jgi:hypothetical protein
VVAGIIFKILDKATVTQQAISDMCHMKYDALNSPENVLEAHTGTFNQSVERNAIIV